MRIISQDRTHSINMDNYELWVQSGTIYYKQNMESRVLGVYQSEERAKEVFDQINSKINEDLYLMPKTHAENEFGTKCINCGADLYGSECRCCGTQYDENFDICADFGKGDFTGKITVKGKSYRVYVAGMYFQKPKNCGRNASGEYLHTERKHIFKLIEV